MGNMNWDDLKFFIAVCNNGSIRAAAKVLGVNHATVSRRIHHFETTLGERLFERSAKGYSQTALAKELYLDASLLEERMNMVQRRVVSQDDTLKGDIRVTFPSCVGQSLVMSDIADFCNLYPSIDLQIVDTNRTLNLLNRETDVAFRLCETPPDYVVGRKLATVHRACYISRKLSSKASDPAWLEQQNWLGWTEAYRRPSGVIAQKYPKMSSKHMIASLSIQSQACIEGMGIGLFPCVYADKEPELVRIPPYISEPKIDLWILSHPDMRTNQKIHTFVHFMTERLLKKRALIEGEEFEIPDHVQEDYQTVANLT